LKESLKNSEITKIEKSEDRIKNHIDTINRIFYHKDQIDTTTNILMIIKPPIGKTVGKRQKINKLLEI